MKRIAIALFLAIASFVNAADPVAAPDFFEDPFMWLGENYANLNFFGSWLGARAGGWIGTKIYNALTDTPNVYDLVAALKELDAKVDILGNVLTEISNSVFTVEMNTLLVPVNEYANAIDARWNMFSSALPSGADAAAKVLTAETVIDVQTAAEGLVTELARPEASQNVLHALFNGLAVQSMNVVYLYSAMQVFAISQAVSITKAVSMMKFYGIENKSPLYVANADKLLKRLADVDKMLDVGDAAAIPKALRDLIVALLADYPKTKRLSAQVSWHFGDDRVRTTLMNNGLDWEDYWYATFSTLNAYDRGWQFYMKDSVEQAVKNFPHGPTTDRFLLQGDAKGNFAISAVYHQASVRGNYTMFAKAIADPARGGWLKLGQGWTACASVPAFQATKFKTASEGNWFKTRRENYEVQLIWDATAGNRENFYIQGKGWAMMTSSLIRPDRLISSMRFPSGYKLPATALCSGGSVSVNSWSEMPTGFKGKAGPTLASSKFNYRFGIKPYAHRTELKVGETLWAGELLQTADTQVGVDPKGTIYIQDRKAKQIVWKFDSAASVRFPNYFVMKDNELAYISLVRGLQAKSFQYPLQFDSTARMTLIKGAAVIAQGDKQLVSFPNRKNVELLLDPSVETDDFSTGKTSWKNRFSGYCDATLLLAEDGEGLPHTGKVFAKVVKDSSSCQSAFSDSPGLQMTLGDKYRFSVFSRSRDPNGSAVKARLAIWTCDGELAQRTILTGDNWRQYSVEYTVSSKVAGKVCSVRAEIYFDDKVGSTYYFDTASLMQV